MRLSLTRTTACCAVTLGLLNLCSDGQARGSEFARFEARQDLEAAKLDLWRYLQVDYPRERSLLDAQIKLTQAEISIRKARWQAVGAFGRRSAAVFSHGSRDDLRLCLLEAELRLKMLLDERRILWQCHSETWRALEMRVQMARRRVAQFEGDRKS